MKLGLTDITKAYYGSLELTSSNAYLGEVQIIDNEPIIEYSGLTFISSGNTTIGLAKKSSYQTIDYSFDGVNWSGMTTATTISLSNGKKVCIRGKLTSNNSGTNYTQFTTSGTGTLNMSGNMAYFWDYTNLTRALRTLCGFCLFSGCTAIVDASQLDMGTSTAKQCYQAMFSGCENLVYAPALPATSLSDSCYKNLFAHCTSLVSAPSLPATTLLWQCYQYMFAVCTSLTTAPALPATTLQTQCYQSMFKDCTSLTTAPEISATTMANSACTTMFQGCTSLTTAPELFAETLSMGCYYGMFSGCTNLNYIKCLAVSKSATNCLTNWVEGVAATGTFVRNPHASWSSGASGIPNGWNILDAIVDYSGLTMEASGDSTVGLAKLSYNQSLQYVKRGDVEWQPLTTATTVNLADGEKMFVRGILSNKNLTPNYTNFKMSGGIYASGNMNYVWNYQNPSAELKIGCGLRMFANCEALKTAPELPATALTNSCYYAMFSGCTSLTTAPTLPATTLPSSCYAYMFQGCTSLTTAPELPATTLAEGCYFYMFEGCTNLNYIKCLATDISANNCTRNWVRGVAASGTFVKNHSMTGWTTGNNGIPTGWTVVDDVTDYSGLTFTSSGNSTVGLAKKSSNQSLEYSKNGSSWSSLTTATTVNLADGEKMYVRGTLSANNTSSDYTQFSMTGNIAASGNMNYVWNYQNPSAALKEFCGIGLFSGCTAITDANGLVLPATTLSQKCYQYLFRYCTSLKTAPVLPATTLSDTCYLGMFEGCSSLSTVPELNATNLSYGCYWGMFAGCTSLTTAPTLPATILTDKCYRHMFNGCTSLTTAPELPATTLATECYVYMFSNCPNLNYVKCLATNISATDCTSSWLSGVSATGTFVKNPSMTGWTTGNNGIPTGWTVVDDVTDYSGLTFTSSGNTTIGLAKKSSNQSLEYSKNGSSWSSLTTATTVNLANGEIMYVRGTLSADNTSSKYTQFTTSGAGTLKVSGNIGYTWNYSNPTASLKTMCGYNLFKGCTAITDASQLVLGTSATTMAEHCYWHMFNGCTSLTSAPAILPATTLAYGCYSSMFTGCSSLTTAPALPATTMAEFCYSGMFYNCTSLTTAPALPATTLAEYCYNGMFNGCRNLTTAPALPATTMANECYSAMFISCTSLTSAPSLPATTLANNCYYAMFNGCTNLTTAPTLPATTLADGCYRNMFGNCTSLVSAPALPATALTDSCYEYMFSECTSLTSAPSLPATTMANECYSAMFQGCTSLTTAPTLPATTLANNCYNGMFGSCTSLTTAPALPATTMDSDCSGCYAYMFEGCTSLTTAPYILPATTLAEHCYESMFQGCTSLTTAPELPATTLDWDCNGCYAYMFEGCTNLNYIKCLATDIFEMDCLEDWVAGVSATGTFVKDASMDEWPTGDSGIPEGWTVQDAT